jgi:hypothetical protein
MGSIDNIPEDQKYHIKMIALLEDIQHSYMVELQSVARYNMKQLLNKCEIETRRFIKYFDKITLPENSENFGIASEYLRKAIDNICLTKKEENETN